jgi:hypothetical protein
VTSGGPQGPAGEPTEEELRAALEEQLKRVRVEQVVTEAAVSILNVAEQAKPIRDALAQLQLAYVKAAGEGQPEEPEGKPEGPGPAQQSGRLWVPGQ